MAQLIGGKGIPQQPKQPTLDLSQAKEITCQSCEGSLFLPANKFLKIPKIAAGTPQDVLIPVEVYVCGDCGELCEELLPKEFKKEK